ncbi:type IV pilus assembly protein PilX [Gammaproteobacteria bacterium]
MSASIGTHHYPLSPLLIFLLLVRRHGVHLCGASDRIHSVNWQRGVVLIVSLVFLLLMSLIGVTAMQGTTLEEKMSNNVRQRSLAFQSAEAALRTGETILQQAVLPVFDNSTPGLRQPIGTGSCDMATYWLNSYCWSGTSTVDCTTTPSTVPASPSCTAASQQYSGTLDSSLNEQPRYVIEELPSMPVAGSSAKFSGITSGGFYRVTARGLGGTGDAIVILQSTFRR